MAMSVHCCVEIFPDPAHDANLDLCAGEDGLICQPVHRQHYQSGKNSGHECGDGSKDRLSLEAVIFR